MTLGTSTINVYCWTCRRTTEMPIGCRVNPCPVCLKHTRRYKTDNDKLRNIRIYYR